MNSEVEGWLALRAVAVREDVTQSADLFVCRRLLIENSDLCDGANNGMLVFAEGDAWTAYV